MKSLLLLTLFAFSGLANTSIPVGLYQGKGDCSVEIKLSEYKSSYAVIKFKNLDITGSIVHSIRKEHIYADSIGYDNKNAGNDGGLTRYYEDLDVELNSKGEPVSYFSKIWSQMGKFKVPGSTSKYRCKNLKKVQ